jgi:hypothetical protein
MQIDGWCVLERHFTDLDTGLGTLECLLCLGVGWISLTFWYVNDTNGETDKDEAAIASLMRSLCSIFRRISAMGG